MLHVMQSTSNKQCNNNTSFSTGITGTVSINENGEKNPDYNLEMLNNGEWVTMFEFIAATQALNPVEVETVTWYGGLTSPPSGTPDCGWENENCQGESTS